MIVIKSRGELGNQIFQYAAVMSALREGESLLLVGFHQLLQTFPQIRKKAFVYTYSKKATKRVQKAWLWLEMQANRGRIGSLAELPDKSPLRRRKGTFRALTLAEGFFQDPKLVDWRAIDDLALVFRASGKLSSGLTYNKEGNVNCFVHVRRGDYLRWPNLASPAAIPSEWYLSQMKAITDWAHPNQVNFHLFSDDIELATQEFDQVPNIYVHKGGFAEDFVKMCSAQAGILSASTFSWWAAYFASRKSSGPFFAPRYWLGFREREWKPENLRADFLTFVDV